MFKVSPTRSWFLEFIVEIRTYMYTLDTIIQPRFGLLDLMRNNQGDQLDDWCIYYGTKCHGKHLKDCTPSIMK